MPSRQEERGHYHEGATRSFKLAYGTRELSLEISTNGPVELLEPPGRRPLQDATAAVQRALREPIGSPPLSELVHSGERVVIIANDVTRSTRSDLFMPLLLDELNRAGVRDGDCEVIFAIGSHRRHTEAEQRSLIGETAFSRVSVRDHDQSGQHRSYGATSRGTVIEVNEAVSRADRVILTGSIVHHFIAGYGGGRKALLPGTASYEANRHNHSLMLDPGSAIGSLDGNPVHEDMLEFAGVIGPTFMLNTVLDHEGRLSGVFAGDWQQAHREGCGLVDELSGAPLSALADIVVASCGGYPKDLNVYQSQKTLENAVRAVRPGGVVVLLAACPDGHGSELFHRWMMENSSLEEIVEKLRAQFLIGAHKAYAFARLLRHAQVIFVSELPDELVRQLWMLPARDPQMALALAAERSATSDPRVVVMPHGGITYPLTR